MCPFDHQGDARREARQLGLLFGAMYFLQGICEPTAGLIKQPTVALLKSWSVPEDDMVRFMALLSVPWLIKPVYGLLSDLVPLCGSRRKSYLVVCSLAALVGFAGLLARPPAQGEQAWLWMALLLPTVGVAFCDVVIDALMVENGQRLGITGRLQAVQWSMIYAASLLTGVLGGWLSQHAHYSWGFALCAAAVLATLGLVIWRVREPPRASSEAMAGAAMLREFAHALGARGVWSIAAFMFLWSFNPFYSTVLNLHVTKGLELSEEFYGLTDTLIALGAIVGSITYRMYCERVPMRLLVHLSIVLGLASIVGYWALENHASAVIVSLVFGAGNMTGMLIQLDLAARHCPLSAAGTIFALLMSVSNAGTSVSEWLGGGWYAVGTELWGRDVAFDFLVAVAALATAGCWLVVPWLPRS